MRKDILKSETMVHCAAIDCTNGSSKKNDESINFFKLLKDPERKKLWISKLKREKLPEEENIYVCHFHFDSSCFKRNFRVYSIFEILYFIHLCVGIECRFCDIHFFFFSLEWITWYIYEKTFNWKSRTNKLFVHEVNSKEKNNRNKTKLFD